jgi:hypothetical protein
MLFHERQRREILRGRWEDRILIYAAPLALAACLPPSAFLLFTFALIIITSFQPL